MKNAIAIAAFAAILLALPQLAQANSSSPDHSSATMQAGFVHWWSLGGAGPEPVQNINGNDIPGAPNGRLAEMLESHPLPAKVGSNVHS